MQPIVGALAARQSGTSTSRLNNAYRRSGLSTKKRCSVVPQHITQPAVPEIEFLQYLHLVGIGVGDVREVAAEKDLCLQIRDSRHQILRKLGVEETDERHGGVESDIVVGLGQVKELLVLRSTQVRNDQRQLRVSAQYVGDSPGTGMGAGSRIGTGMQHDRRPTLGKRAPHRIEQRIVSVSYTHLRAHETVL